ncbi:MAG: 30S ribosomal protein S5 [Nitrospinota bacterium]
MDRVQSEFVDQVIHINRVAKVVKGGRRFSFSALVVVGDKAGKVGFGSGKANEVPEAVRKAVEKAKKGVLKIELDEGTVPHTVEGHFGAGKVLLKPASKGTGVIAGGAVRSIMEVAGIKNILTKCIGSTNKHNVVRATFEGLARMRSKDEINEARRGN